jgi:hypothetical protein
METQVVMPSIRKYDDIGKTSITFQLSKSPGKSFPFYPPTEMIPAQAEILFIPEKKDSKGNTTGEGDMENATNRLIAYLPGMRSIYVDEWSEKEKEAIKERIKSIKFTNGFKGVSTREKTLLEYLRVAGYNEANNDTRIGSGVLYKEVDYEAEAKKVNKLKDATIQAQYFVLNEPIGEVRAYAEALCKTQSEVEEVKTLGEQMLRYKLRDKAVKNPELFVKGLTDPTMRNRMVIAKALQKDIIGTDDKDSLIFWGSNDETFIVAPSGMQVIPYFADISTKNEKYGKIIESLKEQLNEKEEGKEAPLDWIDTFIKQALNSEALVKSNNWFLVPGEDEEEPIMKFNGMKKLRKAVESNEENIMGTLTLKIKANEE